MIQAYVYRDRADYRLHGISLYNLRYNEALEDFVSVHNNYQPYIYQQAQSWGEILLPEPWRQLQLYHQAIVESGIDPVVPNSMTNRWPFKNVRLFFFFCFCSRTLLTFKTTFSFDRAGRVSCHLLNRSDPRVTYALRANFRTFYEIPRSAGWVFLISQLAAWSLLQVRQFFQL